MSKRPLLYLLILLFSGMAWAADVLNWTFTIDNPVQFDPNQVELAGGVVRLKTLDQSDTAKNSGFTKGTFANTFWDSQNQWLTVKQALTLPDNASASSWTDMTGNVLLLHADTATTCTGAQCPQMDADGKIGGALWFDGSKNYLTVPGTWGGADWTEATAEAWVRVDGTTTTSDKMQAIVSSTTTGMFIHFQLLPTGDKFEVAVYSSNNGSKVIGFDPSSAPLALGAWHHVAVSVKSGDIKLFADGKVVGSSNFTFTNLAPISGTQELRIGSGHAKGRFFKGAMDEVAIYKRALSAAEIKTHYDKQSAQILGMYDSRIFSVGSPVGWNSLSWVPVGPNGVQLPGNAASETEYVAGGANMAGNVLLLHLDEASGQSFSDASGKNNTGTCLGADCPTLDQDGKFEKAPRFYDNNIVRRITVPSSPSLAVSTAVTLEAWVYPTAMPTEQGYGVISKGSQNGTPYYTSDYELILTRNTTPGALNVSFGLVGHSYVGSGGQTAYHIYNGNIPLNVWTHVVGTYDAATSMETLYVNGVQVVSKSVTGGNIVTSTKPLVVGVRHIHLPQTYTSPNESHFRGKIDEVAVFNRALSAEEVQNHYLRGAMQPKFQVRACDTADCAGKNFVGPGHSDKTYYTALATVKSPQQTVVLAETGAYFQYRVYFDSSSAIFSPALKSVVIGPNHYPAISPTVTVPTDQSFALLSSFSDILGEGNEGEVRYQVSSDGNTWYFCYGTKWQKTSDPLVMEIPELGELQKTNSASKVNQCAPSFASVAGAGKIFIKAFLHSPTASEIVKLKQIDVGYELKLPAAPPPPPPPEPKVVTLSDAPTMTVAEGSKLSLTLDVSKAGMTAPYQYICQANCPEGMSISSSAGEVSWTPDYQQAGKYDGIHFKVSDAAGKEAIQSLSVVVQDVDSVPQIVNPGDKVVTAGSSLSFTVQANDADGDVPTYAIASGKQEGMEINGSTGFFSWTPKPDQAGAYTVMLRAVDGKKPNLSSDQAMVIIVNKSESSSVIGTTSPPAQLPTAPPTQTTTQAQPASTPAPAAGCSLVR